jgi:hypothetical protein
VVSVIFLCLFISKPSDNKNDAYTQKIHQMLVNGESFLLRDIFEFEFDEAYVIPELYSTGESLLKKYNILSKVEIEDILYNETQRILFLKNGYVIYDYCYSVLSGIFAIQNDLIIFPDTKIIPLSEDASNTVRFAFVDHILNGICDQKYTKKISEIIKQGNKEFVLSDVFDFEFDRVYVVSDNEEATKNLHEKFNLRTSVYMKHDFDSNKYDRVLFIKDDLVVFDYLCPIELVFSTKKGTFIERQGSIPLLNQGTVL